MNLDINFELGDLKFEWDENKNRKNFKKHGIYFEDAVRVFLDENLSKIRDVLVVIYTERENKKRIISARQANKDEEDSYYEQFYF